MLLIFSEEQEKIWEAKRLVTLEKKATQWDVSLQTVEKIEGHESAAEQATTRAKRTFMFYMEKAGVVDDRDNVAEIENIIDDVINAAIATTQAELLKSQGK